MPYFRPFALLFIFWMTAQMTSSNTPPKCRYKLEEAREIDFARSKRIGATFITLKGLKVDSAVACVQACCDESSGQCSLAKYNAQISSAQCLLLECKPLEACLLKNGSHDVAIINRTELQEMRHPSLTTGSVGKNINPVVNGQHKTHTLKNSNLSNSDSGGLKDRFNVTQENVPVTQSFIATKLKDDHNSEQSNDTSKITIPKSVGELNSTTVAPPSHEIGGTSLAYSYSDNLDVEKNKSSVGRKGVPDPPESENEHIVLPNASSTSSRMSSNVPTFRTHSNNSDDSDASLNGATTNGGEQVLQNKTPVPLHYAASSDLTNSSVLIANVSADTNKNLPLNNSTDSTIAVPVHVQLVTSAAVPITNIDVQVIKDSTSKVPGGTLRPTTAHTTDSTSFLIEATNTTKDAASQAKNQTIEDSGGDEEVDQSKVQAGIHLVVALVIGLLLLLTVVGLIIRRVHDVWQRRHYQRMDFLVDGMYNTVST